MIECHDFSFEAECDDSTRLRRFRLLTDLPAGSYVEVRFHRLIDDERGNREPWVLYYEVDELSPQILGDYNGIEDEYDIDVLDKQTLEQLEKERPDFDRSRLATLSTEVYMQFALCTNQRLKLFGENLDLIDGAAVDFDVYPPEVADEGELNCPPNIDLLSTP